MCVCEFETVTEYVCVFACIYNVVYLRAVIVWWSV